MGMRGPRRRGPKAYIHNNPVKAGLVSKAEEWRWSSANPKNEGT